MELLTAIASFADCFWCFRANYFGIFMSRSVQGDMLVHRWLALVLKLVQATFRTMIRYAKLEESPVKELICLAPKLAHAVIGNS